MHFVAAFNALNPPTHNNISSESFKYVWACLLDKQKVTEASRPMSCIAFEE